MRIILILSLFLALSNSALAFSPPPQKQNAPPPSAASILVIDDFEDGTVLSNPEWWIFDNLSATPVRSPSKGAFAFSLKGKALDWYIGGMGTYLAKGNQDLSQYSNLELDIYGFGPDSGTLKIELYDDDNGNWQIEQNPKKAFAPMFDDRFVYELKIDWNGWKHVKIPFSNFIDNNPEAGDNIWNPQQLGGSGGLLQMQFICLANSKTGSINFIIDNLSFAAQ